MVPTFGQLLLTEGDPTWGLALFGLTRAHPALENPIRIEIDEQLARLGLPAERITAGLVAGAVLDFETVAQEILDGKW